MVEVIIYIRTSTDEQNPENQLKDCLSINHYGSFEVIEEKMSAWKMEKRRPNFSYVRDIVKKRKIKHLICWDLDRIYRNRVHLVEFFGLCRACNVSIHSFRQQWLETVHTMQNPWNEIVHDFLIQVMGWMAQDESDKRSDRVKNAVRKDEKGITKSYRGNKWGRKAVSTVKINLIKRYLKENPLISVRHLASEVNLGVGTVHKYLSKIKQENEV